jgi:hypothetical protein
VYSGRCLEVYGWSTQPNARVDQWQCYYHDANQQWYIGSGTYGYNLLTNRNSHLLLNIAGDSAGYGAQAIQTPDNPSQPDQNWSCDRGTC